MKVTVVVANGYFPLEESDMVLNGRAVNGESRNLVAAMRQTFGFQEPSTPLATGFIKLLQKQPSYHLAVSVEKRRPKEKQDSMTVVCKELLCRYVPVPAIF